MLNKTNKTMTKQELKSKIEKLVGEKVSMRVTKKGSMRGFVTFSPKDYYGSFDWNILQSIKDQFTSNDIISIQDINVYMGTTWVWNN